MARRIKNSGKKTGTNAAKNAFNKASNKEAAQSFFARNGRYFFALVLTLLLLQDIFGAHGILAMHRSKEKMREVQAQIAKLDAENQHLEQKIRALKTDPAAIEKIARDRMGLARPGEMIFRMPETKPAPSSPSKAANPQ